jgi:actin-related protein
VLFEGFHVPAVHIASEGVLSLYASGLTTGLVLTMGETQTTALPVIEGNAAHLAGQVNPSLSL